jgi:GxxExxY protein
MNWNSGKSHFGSRSRYRSHTKVSKLDCGYRLDLIVDDKIVLELKSVQDVLPVHEAQLLTYLHLTGLRIGLLINFNVAVLKNGIRRRVL